MARYIDITGKRCGRLTVIREVGNDGRGEKKWLCKCDCGNETIVKSSKLRNGITRSCGCLQKEMRDNGNHKTHGMTNTKLYVIWCNMKKRCLSPGDIMYAHYGGRGITVCEEWQNDFCRFSEWSLTNGYKEGLSIERIDVNGNYEPDNCKWITKTEQYLNRTDSHFITAFGKTKTIKEWADESGLKYDTIERRINQYGWNAEDAVTIKPHGRHR